MHGLERRGHPPASRRGDALALAAPFAVGAVGGIVTAPRIPTWYRSLEKPEWNPPDALFGPVWTSLYLLMGVALVLARHSPRPAGRGTEAVFGLQLSLNLAWSVVFFGRRDIGAARAVIVALWASIVVTIVAVARSSPRAAALLLPYLGWVTFAALLNAEVWRLNRA